MRNDVLSGAQARNQYKISQTPLITIIIIVALVVVVVVIILSADSQVFDCNT